MHWLAGLFKKPEEQTVFTKPARLNKKESIEFLTEVNTKRMFSVTINQSDIELPVSIAQV